jgi:hypothetical protein
VGLATRLAPPPRTAAGRRRDARDRRHEVPQTGPPLGRRQAAVLWRLGQDGELPGGDHGPALGEGARVDPGRGAVFAAGVDARPGPMRAGARARIDSLSREVATRAHVAPARAGGRPAVHGRAGRRGLRGRDGVSRGLASPESAVCTRDLVAPDRLSRHAARQRARRGPRAGPAGHALPPARRRPAGRGEGAGGGPAGARLAPDYVAQRAPNDALARRIRRPPGERRPTTGGAAISCQKSGCSCSGPSAAARWPSISSCIGRPRRR